MQPIDLSPRPQEPLRTAVVGVGSLGRHHARIYSELSESRLVAVCDVDPARAREYADLYGCDAVTDYRALIGQVDAVSIAAPTVEHANIGCDLLEAGVHILVEKPIAASLDEADRLIEAADRTGRVLQVGHVERFNPTLTAVRDRISSPRFIECHRLAAFTPRSLDIDVVMDLMIHDLDIILSIVASDVIEINAAGIGILTPRVDIANARVEFANGCIANITASRVSSERVRKLRLFQPNDYISIDFADREVSVVGILPPDPGSEHPRIAAQALEVVEVEPLKAEIASFLGAVRGERPVEVSGDEGRRALDVAVQVLDSIRRHAEKVGLHVPAPLQPTQETPSRT